MLGAELTGCGVRDSSWFGYYGNSALAVVLPGYTLCVLESDSIGDIKPKRLNNRIYLAYVALAEINNSRWYWQDVVREGCVLEENPDWPGAYRIDIRKPGYKRILIDFVIKRISDYGYDGIFWDVVSVPEYLEEINPTRYSGMTDAAVDIFHSVKNAYPFLYQCSNGGLEPVLRSHDVIDYYAIESTIGTWQIKNGVIQYIPTPQENKDYLYPRIKQIQEAGIKILAWEYGDVTNATQIENIKREARDFGWAAYVSDRNISRLPGVAEGRITFIASRQGINMDFFSNAGAICPDSEKFIVSINGQPTNYDYRSITFQAGDRVSIQLTDLTSYYPKFQAGSWDGTKVMDYIAEMPEPLPVMYMWIGGTVDNFANYFTGCKDLKKVCPNLFANNPSLSFYYAFADCIALSSIPEDVFDQAIDCTSFEGCFSGCTGLTSVPTGLFKKSTKAKTFERCFSKAGLRGVLPKDLFSKCTSCDNFSWVFMECLSITKPCDVPRFTTAEGAFYSCTGLNSVPYDILDKDVHWHANNIANMFAWCNGIPVWTLKIRSEYITNASNFVTEHWQAARTLWVKSGSRTESTFAAARLPGVTLVGY